MMNSLSTNFRKLIRYIGKKGNQVKFEGPLNPNVELNSK